MVLPFVSGWIPLPTQRDWASPASCRRRSRTRVLPNVRVSRPDYIPELTELSQYSRSAAQVRGSLARLASPNFQCINRNDQQPVEALTASPLQRY